MITASKILISGVVQGVFFRARTAEEARKRGLNGFVRNLEDGRVEAWFQGDSAQVNEMINWCKVGPRSARVDFVDIEQQRPNLEIQGFNIR